MSTEQILLISVCAVLMLLLLLMFLPKNHKDIDAVEEYKSMPDEPVMGVGMWILMDILMLIPFVNIIILFAFAIVNTKRGIAFKGWSRANLLLAYLPVIVISIISLITIFTDDIGGISQDQMLTSAMYIAFLAIPLIFVLCTLFTRNKQELGLVTISVFKWLGLILLCFIPVVNLITLFIVSLKASDKTYKTWAKVTLGFSIILTLLIAGVLLTATYVPQVKEFIMSLIDNTLNIRVPLN